MLTSMDENSFYTELLTYPSCQ